MKRITYGRAKVTNEPHPRHGCTGDWILTERRLDGVYYQFRDEDTRIIFEAREDEVKWLENGPESNDAGENV